MHYSVQCKNIKESCYLTRLNDDAQGFVASLISQNFNNNDIIFIAKNDSEAEAIEKQILFFAPNLAEKFEILQFNAWDCQPFDRGAPKQIINTNRIRTLFKLANRQKNNIVITNINAVLQKIIPPSLIKNSSLIAKAKNKISINQIVDFLIFNGYQRQSCAYNASEFALRGGIIDIVMNKANNLVGYRLDFFGDEIESIKEFDPITQISQDLVREIEILPASEIILNDETCNNFRQNYRKNFGQNFNLNQQDSLYEAISAKRYFAGCEHYLPLFYKENLVDIFSYLKNPIIFLNEQIFKDAKLREEEIQNLYQMRIDNFKESQISGSTYNPLHPQHLYFGLNEFENFVEKNINIVFSNFLSSDTNLFIDKRREESDSVIARSEATKQSRNYERIIDLEIAPIPNFYLAAKTNKQDVMEVFSNYLKTNQQKRKLIISCLSESAKDRIKNLLLEFNISAQIVILPLNQGFQTHDLMIVSEQSLFGEKIIRKKSSDKKAAQKILEESLTINLGELVVHRDHGIGKFDGIHKISAGNITSDMIKIIYGGGDTLFVSVEDINLITHYGADNPLIQLDRLGAAAWKNRKAKVRNRIKIAAEQLIKVAASRHVRKAEIFIPDQHFYDEFKARFNFVETEDQLKSIEEVEEDLSRGSPMDRLICGDVGFGKTEVAMRAAFIVASSKKSQVAIITPTTLLCRQHFNNFNKRFEDTNIKIKQISRLTSIAQNKKTREEIEKGEVDIIIGTHALLQKNIKFKNLSLVIVDEEQHFGVAQKERLKELRNEVHFLTLSATPIPRTLQMSLTGVKDLSLIATPPIDRLAVRNFVMPFDSTIIKEAILREYQRSGKVFFVVPRIKDIAEIENKLQKILPEEIRITHAHGQMTPSQLDDIMNDFYDNKIDVLLSTTIIESGIDIASANTIIIHKAEMFGLAQLYQLRGRVGRSKTRGYAYFILSDKKINDQAKKKLEVMQHLDELGVGFTIASHDMDIRGSGDILGDEQSGHIKETGVELYQQMLVEEIEKMKNTISQNSQNLDNKDLIEIEEEINPQIKLGISLLIDENYIPDLSLRMSFYKKIANVKNFNEQEILENEMNDRFGKIPNEARNLIKIAILKNDCKKLAIERLEATKDGVLISFKNNKFKNADKLLQMIFDPKNYAKLQTNQKILFEYKGIFSDKNIDFTLAENKINSGFKIVEKLKFK